MVTVALKYCGSCNPQVDLRRMAGQLTQAAAERGFRLVPLSEGPVDTVVILCGCPRACGNKAEVRAKAKHSLVVAGESLGGKPVREADLPVAVQEELSRLRASIN